MFVEVGEGRSGPTFGTHIEGEDIRQSNCLTPYDVVGSWAAQPSFANVAYFFFSSESMSSPCVELVAVVELMIFP